MNKILLLLTSSYLLTTCVSETKPLAFSSVENQSTYEADISVLYHRVDGESPIDNSINKHIEEAIVEIIGIDSTHSDIPSTLKAFDERYIEFKEDFPNSALPKWELDIETEKLHQSQQVITMGISVYDYQGGAHGNSRIKLLNIDPKSGIILKSEAIIEDLVAFEALAKTHFIKHLNQREENLKMEDYFFGEPFHLPENMGFSDDGFILLYNVYEVASYAQGYTEFAIPYEELDDLLKILPY